MTTLADLRRALDAAVADLPASDLAEAIGVCAATQARFLGRLTTPPAPAAAVPIGEWVTAAEVARRFSLSISTVNELSRQGRLPHRMFGRYRRFNLAAVAAAGLNSESGENGTAIGGRKVA